MVETRRGKRNFSSAFVVDQFNEQPQAANNEAEERKSREFAEKDQRAMWDYSDSEPDDTIVRRCSYCGRFCREDQIVGRKGLCLKCNETVDTTGDGTDGNGSNGHSSASALSRLAAISVELDDSGSESVESVRAESEEPPPAHHGRGCNNEDKGTDLCARCWARPPTKVLYNSPICEVCYQVAQEKREHSKGTNKRYQPPTPHLEPGKRLTRVCDDCRRKRKRCQHRRVVDENDPEADFRRKRAKRERAESEAIREDSRRSSSVIEVLDPIPVPAIPAAAPSAVEIDRESDDDGGSSNDENMKRAINESVQTVYRRELERLVEAAEGKLAEAAGSLDAVKRHMAAWRKHLSGGGNASPDDRHMHWI
ncbi:hypothetical protein AJ80_03880 [Polytolypa hystricis UAMH7299]|uniref:Uncharacterized protein n=1 Tax=Polytolypa hystricis (strain UAMH7299) TaxID=1447883 RepID=A0A2B7Y5V7_POLH7|nr:hypothetical protein AJ80_03880 [Polytolypa hystricis UAMH7299]